MAFAKTQRGGAIGLLAGIIESRREFAIVTQLRIRYSVLNRSALDFAVAHCITRNVSILQPKNRDMEDQEGTRAAPNG
jgi:hypothetical protein